MKEFKVEEEKEEQCNNRWTETNSSQEADLNRSTRKFQNAKFKVVLQKLFENEIWKEWLKKHLFISIPNFQSSKWSLK